MPVNTERKDFADMKVKWARLRDCIGGRDAILKAGVKYVPLLPAKDLVENEDYRRRGSFYNATKRTVEGMMGSIFQEAPEVEFPEDMKPYLDDITLGNVPFEMFAQTTGNEVMLIGRFGVLVDMSSVPSIDNRPYCIGYLAEDIVNWKTSRLQGAEVLTMLVLRESIEQTVPTDPFISEVIEQYRELRLVDGKCIVQLWRPKSEKEKNVFVHHGTPVTLNRRGEALPFIPFVFICASNATSVLEEPPLIDLADVNLGHWRNSVDYEYGLHLVALPTPWVAGARASGADSSPLPIGPSKVWELDIQGSAGMLEFSGEGLGALVTAMNEKKKQMATLGARLLEDSAIVPETASAVTMRHAGEHASLRTVAQSVELGFTLVLRIVAWWMGNEALPQDTEVGVELNKDYLNVKASPQDIQAALAALQAEEISYETWWNILVTGGWGREGIDADAEVEAIEKRRKEREKNKPKPPPQSFPPRKPGYQEPPPPEPGV